MPPPDADALRMPTSLRVWAPDHEATVLAWPFVRADTLYGRSRGNTLSIPLSAVRRLERQRLEVGRTVAAVVGGLALWTTVGLVGGGWE
jgi:hypothetical protein